MEVYVTDCFGIPDDAIVSIRFGATRRQAPLETVGVHPLKFPVSGEAVCEPLKIDVLLPIATTRLVLHPSEDQYRIGFHSLDGSDNPMEMGLNIRGALGSGGGSDGQIRPGSAMPVKFQDAAASAKDYLEAHGLLRYVQSLLHAVIQVKPKDPYSFMMDQLGAAQTKTKARPMSRPGSAMPSAREFPGGLSQAQVTRPTSAALHQATPPQEARPVASLRSVAPPAAAPPQFLPDGPVDFDEDVPGIEGLPPYKVQPDAEPSPTSPQPPAELEGEVKLDAPPAAVGRPLMAPSAPSALGSRPAPAAPGAPAPPGAPGPPRAAPAAPSACGVPPRPAPSAPSVADRGGFSAAPPPGAPVRTAASAPPAEPLVPAVSAAECLGSSASGAPASGSSAAPVVAEQPPADDSANNAYLQEVLVEAIVSQEELSLQQIKEKLRAKLQAASESGLLDAALESIRQEEPPRQIPQQAEVKANVRTVMEDATADGSLAIALATATAAGSGEASDQEEVERVKEKVRAIMRQATESGTLQSALASVLPPPPPPPPPPPEETDPRQAMKERLRGHLQEATESGSLAAALKPPSEVDALKGKLQRLMQEACENGNLEAALGVISSQPPLSNNPIHTSVLSPALREMKAQLQNCLRLAVQSGQLSSALESIATPRDAGDLAPPPTMMAPPQGVVAPSPTAMAPQQGAVAPSPTMMDPQAAPPDNMDEMRAQLRDMMQKSAKTGELEATLVRLSSERPDSAEGEAALVVAAAPSAEAAADATLLVGAEASQSEEIHSLQSELTGIKEESRTLSSHVERLMQEMEDLKKTNAELAKLLTTR